MRQKDFFQFRQFTIDQRHAAMKVGTDSDLLGALALGGEKILDIGTGTGVISLMMAQRFPEATIEAIEIDENAFVDASANFSHSIFADRIAVRHISFQEYAREDSPTLLFDAIVCNPPYFDRSLECDDSHRTKARHTSSLPFSELTEGVARLLRDGGVFSVCIPLEVRGIFIEECERRGLRLLVEHRIRTAPEKEAKRFVLSFRKGGDEAPRVYDHSMLNEDRSRSEWYYDLLHEFLII